MRKTKTDKPAERVRRTVKKRPGTDTGPATPDPLRPGVGLLSKIGSVIVHAEEFFSPDGHEIDKQEFAQRLADPEVHAWLRSMTKLALIPVKRVARP